LTAVKSEHYHNREARESFVNDHPTEDKNMLTNKIVARMMLNCKATVSQEQVAFL
jgi:hypothetical protein